MIRAAWKSVLLIVIASLGGASWITAKLDSIQLGNSQSALISKQSAYDLLQSQFAQQEAALKAYENKEVVHATVREIVSPIPMVIYCPDPNCQKQHIDEGE